MGGWLVGLGERGTDLTVERRGLRNWRSVCVCVCVCVCSWEVPKRQKPGEPKTQQKERRGGCACSMFGQGPAAAEGYVPIFWTGPQTRACPSERERFAGQDGGT